MWAGILLGCIVWQACFAFILIMIGFNEKNTTTINVWFYLAWQIIFMFIFAIFGELRGMQVTWINLT